MGSSTDSLVLKNGTFIFSVLGFNAKSIKATLSILKLVLFAVLKLMSETPINCSNEKVDTPGSISLSHFFPKRLTMDPLSQSPLNFELFK